MEGGGRVAAWRRPAAYAGDLKPRRKFGFPAHQATNTMSTSSEVSCSSCATPLSTPSTWEAAESACACVGEGQGGRQWVAQVAGLGGRAEAGCGGGGGGWRAAGSNSPSSRYRGGGGSGRRWRIRGSLTEDGAHLVGVHVRDQHLGKGCTVIWRLLAGGFVKRGRPRPRVERRPSAHGTAQAATQGQHTPHGRSSTYNWKAQF